MAEPYVPIADFNTSNTLLTALEVTTNASAVNANALGLATANALTARNLAEDILGEKFDFFLLVGA
jgi:hypothetical protein